MGLILNGPLVPQQNSESEEESPMLMPRGSLEENTPLNLTNPPDHRPFSIIAVANHKGGCAKTTTAINLAAVLAEWKFSVLMIDADPQAQASLGLGIGVKPHEPSLYEVLLQDLPVKQAIYPTAIPGLKILPSNSLLAGAQLDLAICWARESILKTALNHLLSKETFDYVLIDCSPSLNLITINALSAATHVIVPLPTQYFALQGMKELFHTLEILREKINPHLAILGILATLFDKRNKINHEILKQIQDYFKDLVFHCVIRANVKLCEAPIYKMPINQYAPRSYGAEDYRLLAQEVVSRTQGIIKSGSPLCLPTGQVDSLNLVS